MDIEQKLKEAPIQLTFKETDSIIFKIESNIWLDACNIYLVGTSENQNLLMFNQFDLTLNIYDFDSRQKIETIQFEKEGPNSTGKNIDQIGFFPINQDSFLIHNYWERKIRLFDSNAKLLSTVDLPNAELSAFSTIVTHTPPFLIRRTAYFPNISQGLLGDKLILSDNVPALLKLEVQNGITSFVGQRSKVYDEGYNIAGDNSYTFATYNPNSKKIVYSFRQDPNIYLMDIETGKTTLHDAASRFVGKPVAFSKTFAEGYNSENSGDKKLRFYILTSGKYDKIYYDAWRKMYYRIAILPRTKTEYDEGQFNFKYAVIILNEDMNKVGEWQVPSSRYVVSYIFPVSEGILIAREPVKEDELIFSVLHLEPQQE
jgi:hypothetical protein